MARVPLDPKTALLSLFFAWRVIMMSRFVLVAVGALLQRVFVYAPPLQRIFGSAGLRTDEWIKIIIAGLLLFAVAKVENGDPAKRRRTGLKNALRNHHAHR